MSQVSPAGPNMDLMPGFGSLLTNFASQAAARQNDMAAANQNRAEIGANALAEATRLDYLKNKDNISFAQGTGQRIVDESGSGRARQLDNTAQPTSSSKPA